MNLAPIALEGVQRAEAKLETTARRMAAIGAADADSVDLSTEAVALIEAKNAYEANINVMKTAQEMDTRLLDVLG